ncbi:MAG TPA: hypothetical protein VK809_04725, partial [Bacteroidia bacterium]|nr:hypothetical protein [Bacteroidia bacterium]
MYRQIRLNTTLVLSLLVLLVTPLYSYSQKGSIPNNKQVGRTWSKNPFDYKVFIENRGQWATTSGKKILFQARLGKTQLSITSHGLMYSYVKLVEKRGNEEEEGTGAENSHFLPPEVHTAKMEWVNSNVNVTIEAQQEQTDYYSYRTDDDKTVRTNAFKKIICHNLYPGIDVEYFFPEKGEGIRYDLIIHPGADLSKLKMNYSGFQSIEQDGIGNIALCMADSATKDIIDSVPHTYYSDTHELLASSFIKTGNTISFAVNNYDKTREMIIDPWMVDPGFTSDDKALDIAKDLAGNIYVYGGGGSGTPWELKKFTPLGTLVWTYVTSFTGSSWYGDLAVDPAGNSFISEGCCDGIIEKINTNDSVIWTITNGVYEYWLLTFDCSFTNLYLGCAYTSGAIPAESISHLDVNTGAITGAVALNTAGSEPRDIAWAPNGDLYFLSCYGNDHVLAVTPAFTNIFSI